MDIRNVAIIAHVDHGKTTLIDGLLKQSKTFRENEAEMSQSLILDSNDQEKERGITISAKNVSVTYKGTKINIIDTPGHADFGGEVERTLNMANGALLIIDAQEGPMPQTKFVLKKALDLGLQVIVVINKIDKKNARVKETVRKTGDLFLELANNESQLDFPVLFAVGREGKSWDAEPSSCEEPADLTPVFKAILKYVSRQETDLGGPFQMLVSSLDWDSFRGKYAIGKISRGVVRKGQKVSLLGENGSAKACRVESVYVTSGLKRVEVGEAVACDIVAIAGIKEARIGDTVADVSLPEALPRIEIGESTLKIAVAANTSPFAGQEGEFCTARQIEERIKRELETNISLKLEKGNFGEFVLYGRGELHLSVFIERMRREGYELQVSKPQVVTKIIDDKVMEPVEELTVDVPSEYASAIVSEVAKRRGNLVSQTSRSNSSAELVFEITTRGLLGLGGQILTLSKGTAVMNSFFLKYKLQERSFPKLRRGVLVASDDGKALTYGLNVAQGRGITFVPPQTQVYRGMIIGLNSRDDDIEINVCKEKKQTNVRSSTSDIAVVLTPPTILSLEQCIEFLEDDELLEVTPHNLRLRKKILDPIKRYRSNGTRHEKTCYC